MSLASVVHAILMRTDNFADRHQFSRRLWSLAYQASNRRWGLHDVTLRLHGRPARINFANPYPRAVHRYPNYNAPQVELVILASEAAGRPVTIVDIGAAVGDTALLVLDRCRDVIERLICIEGDASFMRLLRTNLTDDRVTAHLAMLAESEGEVANLVRSEHAGTASAAGTDRVPATTLDRLLTDQRPDVLKVDTDGFDGKILAGGCELLAGHAPAVLFEWHPRLCQQVGADPLLAFRTLRAAGYDRWVWFTKFGQFSHFGDEAVEELTRLCLTSRTLYDWHYDVVALHQSSPIDPVAVADLAHWGDGGWR